MYKVSVCLTRSSYIGNCSHLPHHGKGSTNGLWRGLGGVNGRSRGLCTDGEPEHETRDEEIRPYRKSKLSVALLLDAILPTAVSGRHPDTGDERNDA